MVRRAVPVLLAGFCGLGYTQLRGLILNCGATSEEATGRLPGDELLEKADGVSTRAIEIDAPASAVWPWLAQLGPSPRVGPTPTTGSRTWSASTCTARIGFSPSSKIPPSATRSASARTTPRTRGTRTCARLAQRGRQLGVVVRTRADPWQNTTHQPQPLCILGFGTYAAVIRQAESYPAVGAGHRVAGAGIVGTVSRAVLVVGSLPPMSSRNGG